MAVLAINIVLLELSLLFFAANIISAINPFVAAIKNDIPATPKISAIWISLIFWYWLCPSSRHKKPPNP